MSSDVGVMTGNCKHGHARAKFGMINGEGVLRCRKCASIATRKYGRNYPERRKISNRKWKYNLGEEQYQQMLKDQDYRCVICGTHQDEVYNGLHVDHCHNSLSVRGLLCTSCNTGLGLFKDDIGLMLEAVEYLRKSEVLEIAS